MRKSGKIRLNSDNKYVLIDHLNRNKQNYFVTYKKMENELKVEKKKIKWNIEKSIEFMYINTNMEYIMNYFYIEEKEKVTPKMFITTIVENYLK